MSKQPEALLLADVLEGDDSFDNRAAAELRRLHEVNQELLEALKSMLYDDEHGEACSKAIAAIAKAEGETK